MKVEERRRQTTENTNGKIIMQEHKNIYKTRRSTTKQNRFAHTKKKKSWKKTFYAYSLRRSLSYCTRLLSRSTLQLALRYFFSLSVADRHYRAHLLIVSHCRLNEQTNRAAKRDREKRNCRFVCCRSMRGTEMRRLHRFTRTQSTAQFCLYLRSGKFEVHEFGVSLMNKTRATQIETERTKKRRKTETERTNEQNRNERKKRKTWRHRNRCDWSTARSTVETHFDNEKRRRSLCVRRSSSFPYSVRNLDHDRHWHRTSFSLARSQPLFWVCFGIQTNYNVIRMPSDWRDTINR